MTHGTPRVQFSVCHIDVLNVRFQAAKVLIGLGDIAFDLFVPELGAEDIFAQFNVERGRELVAKGLII